MYFKILLLIHFFASACFLHAMELEPLFEEIEGIACDRIDTKRGPDNDKPSVPLYTWYPVNKPIKLIARRNKATNKPEIHCPICPDYFSGDYKSTRLHVLTKHKDSDLIHKIYPFECTACSEPFATLGNIKKHLTGRHNIDQRVLKESEADRIAQSTPAEKKCTKRSRHKDYYCACGKKSIGQETFKIHLTVCDAGRLKDLYPEECDLCNKRFQDIKGLNRHRNAKNSCPAKRKKLTDIA